MRPGQNQKRARGRGRKPSSSINRTFDSSGPDVKIRGSALQIYEKYQALARDAQASGDLVTAENYLQHAEHYFRLLNAMQFNAFGDQRHQNGMMRPHHPQPNGEGMANGAHGGPQGQGPNGGEGHRAPHGEDGRADEGAGEPDDGTHPV